MIEARAAELDGGTLRVDFPALTVGRVVRRLCVAGSVAPFAGLVNVYVGPHLQLDSGHVQPYRVDRTGSAGLFFVREYSAGLEWPAGAELQVTWADATGAMWARVEYDETD